MTEPPSRTLATIVSIDAAGYSASAERDDESAVNVVAGLRARIGAIAGAHAGRIFNTAGDGIMLEFPSADAALRAVLEMLGDRTVIASRARIGMHVGDVRRMADGDLLGHGVNVAARLQALASPGTAVTSAAVIDLVRGQLTHGLTSLGRVRLDKMDETIEVFVLTLSDGPAAKPSPAFRRAAARVYPVWALPAAVAVTQAVIIAAVLLFAGGDSRDSSTTQSTSAGTGINLQSVAVLPFENLSTDKDNAFFAVGIQDEILTRLTKIGSLKVISRTSTSHIASRPDNLPDIARELGVAYILEGSVQRSGNAVRINVQLINAATDTHVWAEVYDRALSDIFRVQSEIAIAVAESLNANVSGREEQVLSRTPTANAAAYDAYLRARVLYSFSSKADPTIAPRIEKHLAEAIRRDPGFAEVWALLAMHHAAQYFYADASDARREATLHALKTARSLSPDLEEVRLAEGYVQYRVERDYDGARHHFENLLKRWPNNPEILGGLAAIAKRQGRWDQSKAYAKESATLDPRSYDARMDEVALHSITRDFDEAIHLADAALNIWPDDPDLLNAKVKILQCLGRLDEADALLRPLQPDPDDATLYAIAAQAALRRNYDASIILFESLLAKAELSASIAQSTDLNTSLGFLLELSGNAARAKLAYRRALDGFHAQLKAQPQSAYILQNLAFVYTGLGEREKAELYAGQAVRLALIVKDLADGASAEDTQMRVWARFGDRALAIPAIARLLKLPGSSLTPALLRLDPDFDKLRGDPRFEVLANGDVKSK